MSNNSCKRPAGYRPNLLLSVREQCEGGGVAANVVQEPAYLPGWRREAVLLVHGFNNHFDEAVAAYLGFRRRQHVQFVGLKPGTFERRLGDVFWPGDADWGMVDLLDFLVYPVAVGKAKDTAGKLAVHLQTMPNLFKLDFIGHSLGCRVILEVIKKLHGGFGPLIGRVCLMAAAVPLKQVESGGALDATIAAANSALILHSTHDRVLKYAFRAGQTMAGKGEGLFPKALGAVGPTPRISGVIRHQRIDGARHSDYWGHNKRPVSVIAPTITGQYLGFSDLVRTLAVRPAGNATMEIETRVAGSRKREAAGRPRTV